MELQELALRIRRGDREALKTLISEYGVGVYQKAYQKTQDKSLAREATRQTFAQLVTALQEQTDMDGWELWLNALAKRNIETYTNIGSDMAYLENQLDRELFASAPAAPSDTAMRFAAQQQYEAQQAQLRTQQQYEAQQAQLRVQQQYEAQQAQLRAQQQYEAQQAQLRAQQQYEAQLRLAQYEKQLPVQQPAMPPTKPAAAELPANSAAQAQEAKPTTIVETAPELPEEFMSRSARSKRSGKNGKDASAWPVIVLLTILCIVLVWLVVGVVMSFGWIPKLDIGYEWFNTHILELF